MTLLDTINIGGVDYGINSKAVMGTCATPAGTEVKECLFADSFILAAGNIISVTFTYANTYGDGSTTYPKILINGTQYPVKVPTGAYAGDGAWANGQVVTLVCDGTNLIMATAPAINVVDTIANDNMNAVTSNAVFSGLAGKVSTAVHSGLITASSSTDYALPVVANGQVAVVITTERQAGPGGVHEDCGLFIYGHHTQDNTIFTKKINSYCCSISSTHTSAGNSVKLTVNAPPEYSTNYVCISAVVLG